MSTSEYELIEQWFDGRDPEAFRQIVISHAGTVYGVCRRILGDSAAAEDVSQECFEVLAGAKRVPHKRSLGAWLHGVATKRSLQYIRTDNRRRQRENRFAAKQSDHAKIEWNDIYEYVDEAIAELPEKLRVPLVMHFLESESKAGIARATDISARAAAFRIEKGLEQVRKTLKRRGLSISTMALGALMVANIAEAAPPSLVASLGKLAIAQGVSTATVATASTFASKLVGTGGAGLVTKSIVSVLILVALVVGVHTIFIDNATQDEVKAVTASAPQSGQVALADSKVETPQVETTALSNDTGGEAAMAVVATTEDGCLAGRVLDPNGILIKEAKVELISLFDRSACQETVAPGGQFEFYGLKPGRKFIVVASHAAHGLAMSPTITMPAEGDGPRRIDMYLGRGHRAYGRVIDQEDLGIEGVEVLLGIRVTQILSVRHEAKSTTDKNGYFEFADIGAGDCHIGIKTPNFRQQDPMSGYFTMPSDKDYGGLEIVVVRKSEGFLSGRVADSEGAPIEGARVSAGDAGQTIRETSETDAQGNYTIEGIGGASSFFVAAFADGYVMEMKQSIPVNSRNVDFELARTATISGHVFDAVTGEPIEQFRAKASLPTYSQWSEFDSVDGSFSLTKVAPGLVKVLVEAKGYAQAESEEYRISSGDNVSDVEIGLTELNGKTVQGIVFDPDDGPVGAATVTLICAGDPGPLRNTATESGHYSFAGLVPGREYVLVARHAQYGSANTDVLPVSEDIQSIERDIHFGHGHNLRGRVTDIDDNGIARAQVHLAFCLTVSMSTSYGLTVTSDGNGDFELQHVGNGDFVVHADASGYRHGYQAFEISVTQSADDLPELKVVLERDEEGFVSGTVSDVEGNPIYPARVYVRSLNLRLSKMASVTRDGAFRVDGVGGYETLHITATAEGYATEFAKVPVNSDDVHVTLERNAKVRGHIVDADTGKPIEDFSVRIEPTSGTEPDRFAAGYGKQWINGNSISGEFELECRFFEAPFVRVVATAKGYSTAKSDIFKITPGGLVEGITVRLSKGVGLAGRVTDGAGNALSGVRVNTFEITWKEEPDGQATTDSDGLFSLDGIVPGSTVNLLAQRKGYAVRIEKNVEVFVQETTYIDLELRPEARIEGSVSDGSRPVPDLWIQATTMVRGNHFLHMVKTDNNGDFRLAALPAGKYKLRAQQRELLRLRWTTTVQVAEGETLEVNFHEPDDGTGTSRITGSVSAPDSPSNYNVFLKSSKANGYGSTIGMSSDGTFVFDFVPPGKYTIAVIPFGRGAEEALTEMEVVLEADRTTEIALAIE